MKNLNLENLGIQEMDAKEMENVDGGGFWAIVWPLAVSYVLVEAALNPNAHMKALKDGWNSH